MGPGLSADSNVAAKFAELIVDVAVDLVDLVELVDLAATAHFFSVREWFRLSCCIHPRRRKNCVQ